MDCLKKDLAVQVWINQNWKDEINGKGIGYAYCKPHWKKTSDMILIYEEDVGYREVIFNRNESSGAQLMERINKGGTVYSTIWDKKN